MQAGIPLEKDYRGSLLFGVLVMLIGGSIGFSVIGLASPARILIFAVGLIAVFGTLVRAELGLLILAFMTYMRLSEVLARFHGVPSIVQPFTALLIVAVLVQIVIYRQHPQGWQRVAVLLGSYGLIGLMSLVWAADYNRAYAAVFEYVKDGSVAMFAVLLIQSGAVLRRVVWAILIAGIILGTLSLFQYVTGTYTNNYWGFAQAKTSIIVDGSTSTEYRMNGPFPDAVFYAQFLLILVPLALDRLGQERSLILRGLAGWSLAVCVLSLLLTFSRGGFLGLMVMLGMIMIRRPPPLGAILSTIAIAIPLMQFAPDSYTHRLGTIVEFMPGIGESDLRNDDSFRGRSSEMIVGWLMFTDHPVFGVGLGNYNARYLEYSRWLGIDPRLEDRSAHCLYLEIASETGLVGLSIFLWLVWVMFRELERAYKALTEAGLTNYAGIAGAVSAGMIGYLTAAIFLHAAFPRPFWFLFGIALALPNVARYEIERQRQLRQELQLA